jgi:hypothetical protein
LQVSDYNPGCLRKKEGDSGLTQEQEQTNKGLA